MNKTAQISGLVGIVLSTSGMALTAEDKVEKESVKYTNLTDENYKKEVLEHKGPCIVLFYDSNDKRSPPSARMEQVIDELIKEYSGKIKFGKYDVTQHPNTTSTKDKMEDDYEIIKYPTTYVYKNGKKTDSLRGCPD